MLNKLKKIFSTEENHPQQQPVVEDPTLPVTSNLAGIVGEYEKYVNIVNEKVKSVTINYPASSGYHGCYKGGLWEHSIQTAVKMAEYFTKYSTRESFIAYLIGLMHDTGKIATYKYETAYKHVPLQLNGAVPEDLRVTGSITNDNRLHARLSALLAYYFLQPVIEVLKLEEFLVITETIENHHSKVILPDNPYIETLKEIDTAQVKTDMQENVAKQPTTQEQNQPLQQEQSEENKNLDITNRTINIEIWKKILIRKMERDWIKNYAFYVIKYENRILLLITTPKYFSELNNEYCKTTNNMYHDSAFIEVLKENGYIAMAEENNFSIVKASIKLQGSNRKLKFIALDAEKILNTEQINEYITALDYIKIKGNFIHQ